MYKDKKVWAIVLAAGKGSRMGFDKMMYKLDKHTVVYHSVAAFENNECIDSIIVAAGENIDRVRRQVREFPKMAAVVPGGTTRAQSVMNALEKAEPDCLIAIHDGARPFVTGAVISAAIEKAAQTGAAAPAVPVKDTVKEASGGLVERTLDRSRLYAVQTPQVFEASLIRAALQKALEDGAALTDDCAAVERLGMRVSLTPGDERNIKLTTPADLLWGQALLESGEVL